ncbi:MAG TPA: hypothetical protein PK307_00290 [Spirochaetota bacterium]|nr:hypothetical protein [Spirochaetota bacterium]HOD15200.1 hypothetical protein [Spirochaetota bacterium]HPG50380.1 hypothetical protein [Spirochaetota bacterium]HPN10905.1 hypothetical protein [Spirochaetota bacterium]HQL80608.1 hypothetical protein [Spirochaetota bacterium]
MKTEPDKKLFSLDPDRSTRRLYGKNLIRASASTAVKNVLLTCVLLLPVLAAAINVTCLMQPRTAAADPYWNDVARYLAGMEVRGTSVLKPKTADPRYRAHIAYMDNLWGMIRKETIDLIGPWRNDNIPSVGGGGTAFYPLSGADFINLFTLYPDARTYLMIALEQPGDAALLRDHASNRFLDGLMPIQRGIYLYGLNNYFQSKVMKQEMNNTLLPGTAPALLIFMARMGLTITGVENITIGNTGNIVSAGPAQGAARQVAGIRILFTGSGAAGTRELIYLSMRLEPDSVDTATPEGRFFNRLHRTRTMLKSAVYILQDEKYAPLKDFILKRSALIVQDDSGISFGAFDGRWKVSLYGKYNPYMSLGGCTVRRQEDLAQAYARASFPLPFNFGYGILQGQGQSNLMVAKKK